MGFSQYSLVINQTASVQTLVLGKSLKASHCRHAKKYSVWCLGLVWFGLALLKQPCCVAQGWPETHNLLPEPPVFYTASFYK
jgi:hypothetical protein